MSDLFSKPLPMGEFFDRVADQYDEVHTSHIDNGADFYVAIAEPVTPVDTPVDILSLGAGTGLDLVEVIARAPHARLHCIDLSAKMLEKLSARFEGSSASVITMNVSLLDIGFEDRTYDYVLAAATLHHFTDEEKRVLYPRLARACGASGKLIIGDFYVTAAESAQWRAAYDGGLEEGYDFRRGNYHMDIPTTLDNEMGLLRQSGFDRIETIWQSSNYTILVAT